MVVIDEESMQKIDCDRIGFQPLIVFDCRECEPVHFVPYGPWTCRNPINNNCYTELDLASDWADFDVPSKRPVSILNFKSHFVRF